MKVLINDTTLQNLASAIRSKTGSSDQLKPSDMVTAIDGISNEIIIDGAIKFNNSKFTSLPNWLEGAVYTGDLTNCFKGVSTLTSINLQNTTGVTNLTNTFNGCNRLTDVTLGDTQNVTTFASTFVYCSNLVTAPELDLTSCTTLGYCFENCGKLENVPAYNAVSVTNAGFNGMFHNCSRLSDVSLNNILLMLSTNSNQWTANKKLKEVGLNSTQATTCTSFEIWETLSANGWTTGY